MTENKNCLIGEKMDEIEDTEEDVMRETSVNFNRKRNHRRGKRKFRQRRRTTSTELKKQGETKDKLTKASQDQAIPSVEYIQKEITTENLENEMNKKEIKVFKKTQDEIDKLKKFKRSAEKKKKRHRHPPHRNIKQIYTCVTNEIRNTGDSSKNKRLILRPNKCPDAPKNSTQFIIDDHEGDEEDTVILRIPQGPNTIENSGQYNETLKESSGEEFQPSPDDDTFWADYLERDFQNVYESAHREDVANWDKSKLIEEITKLEKRHRELVNQLSRVDPEVYLRHLHSRVVSKQQRNNRLKAKGKYMTDKINQSRRNTDKLFLVAAELEKTAVNEKCQIGQCEAPSQSDTPHLENSTNSNNIVSLFPDSTNE